MHAQGTNRARTNKPRVAARERQRDAHSPRASGASATMSDEESSSDEIMKPPERRELSSRGNKGNRMSRLIAEEADDEADEGDKEFYEQGFWADEEEDDDFAAEDADDEEARDSFDSDFGDSSDSSDDDGDDDADKPAKKSKPKKSVYRDPKLAHKKGTAPAARPKAPSHKKRAREGGVLPVPNRSRDSMRGSTQHASKEVGARARRPRLTAPRPRAAPLPPLPPLTPPHPLPHAGRGEASRGGGGVEASRRARRRDGHVARRRDATAHPGANEALAAPRPRPCARSEPRARFALARPRSPPPASRLSPPTPHPPPPQEEILEEAKLTEADNRASLAMMLHQEEEKRRVIVRERDLKGPRVRFVSKRNGDSVTNTYTFVETPVPPAINAVAPPKPQPQRCAVTQAPAKYLDPSTGAPYANLEAYRHLRGRQGSRRQSVSFGTPSGGDV